MAPISELFIARPRHALPGNVRIAASRPIHRITTTPVGCLELRRITGRRVDRAQPDAGALRRHVDAASLVGGETMVASAMTRLRRGRKRREERGGADGGEGERGLHVTCLRGSMTSHLAYTFSSSISGCFHLDRCGAAL